MLFNVEADHGHEIIGYLVPDNGNETPVVRILRDGRPAVDVACNVVRDAVRMAGRHSTGMVGFQIDAEHVPDLTPDETLAIVDARSRVPIYRRPLPGDLAMGVFRLETQWLPLSALDRSLARRFQYACFDIERFGHETVTQTFHMHAVQSIYHAGRHLYRNYHSMIPEHFLRLIVLQDPYVELAERLLMLAAGPEQAPDHLGERDFAMMMFGFEWFEGANLASVRNLRTALARMPGRVDVLLRSPLTRQLATQIPDEPTTTASLTAALDSLSEFTVIARREAPQRSADDIAAVLGIEPGEVPIFEAKHEALQLAERLRDLQVSEALLAEDLVLHHYLARAEQRA